MGFVCERELFEIIEKNFLQGDSSLPAAQGELNLLLLVLSSLSPAECHATHLWFNRRDHAAHKMFLYAHVETLREIRQDF